MADPGANKRRLPVLPSTDDTVDPERPAWQWIGVGAVATTLAWLLLAMAVNAAFARLIPDASALSLGWRLAVAAANVAAIGVAAAGGGALVGRFGALAGLREATLSGLASGALGALLTALVNLGAAGSLAIGAIVCAASVGGAYAGGRLGLGARTGAGLPKGHRHPQS